MGHENTTNVEATLEAIAAYQRAAYQRKIAEMAERNLFREAGRRAIRADMSVRQFAASTRVSKSQAGRLLRECSRHGDAPVAVWTGYAADLDAAIAAAWRVDASL